MIISKYVGVIVDVATQQTNRPYTYRVPEELTTVVAPGMRVEVPFGRRQVQGFVVETTDQAPEGVKLRSLTRLVDVNPVLGEEQLQLADWLVGQTFAFKISCLQAMLPAAMRAQYQKTVVLVAPEKVPADVRPLFGEKGEIAFDDDRLTPAVMRTIAELQRSGAVKIVYHVTERGRKKTVPQVVPCKTAAEYRELATHVRTNAVRQRELLDRLAQLDAPVLQADFLRGTHLTVAHLRAAEKQGWLTRKQVEQYRDPFNAPVKKTQAPPLMPDQEKAVAAITAAEKAKTPTPFLLEGVTGSGKTEVYLQTIAAALKYQRTALMLVPEIALTPQMVNRVRGRFGHQVAVLHSGLSVGEKYDEWRRIARGEAQVVVGARSAVFAPLKNIGIIIIDEEHEGSYKQDSMPRYHARDVALWRARYHQCPVVLGSATPALESRARAQKGVYQWLRLPHRINGQDLPRVQLVDMRRVMGKTQVADFSPQLVTALRERLNRNEQVVLMLNRRGYAAFAMCRECGFVVQCPNCDISLTFHRDRQRMQCHYCGHEQPVPKKCPQCGSRYIGFYGTGTQKVAEELHQLVPAARVLRMDVDTTRRKGAHERILEQFGNHDADVLLGTQMIAKGLDFPDVTLVGVLNADTGLSLPDFRASERTFQLLTQVSGRAGRADKAGEVIIQTFNPDHYAIQLAGKQDYEGFFVREMQVRHQNDYPPYFYTIQLTASGPKEAQVLRVLAKVRGELTRILSPQARLLGPTPQMVTRVNNRYYYQLIIKYKQEPQLQAYLQKLALRTQRLSRQQIQLTIDRDPQGF